jgi:hypothetical protein
MEEDGFGYCLQPLPCSTSDNIHPARQVGQIVGMKCHSECSRSEIYNVIEGLIQGIIGGVKSLSTRSGRDGEKSLACRWLNKAA